MISLKKKTNQTAVNKQNIDTVYWRHFRVKRAFVTQMNYQLLTTRSEITLIEIQTALCDFQVERLLRSSDVLSVLCDPDELSQLLTTRSEIPLTEIQTALCDFDVDDVMDGWRYSDVSYLFGTCLQFWTPFLSCLWLYHANQIQNN